MSTSSITPSGSPGNPAGDEPDSRQRWKGSQSQGRDWQAILAALLRRSLWGILILGAIALFSWLIWLLLLAPRRTPVIVLAPAPYHAPLPPNAWAAEDVQKLSLLDGQTISLRGADTPVFKNTDFLDRLDDEIRRSNSLSKRVPLVVWVSLHGIAEGETSDAYLIPPKASPHDVKSWVPLRELVTRLHQAGKERPTLLILDSSRMQLNWALGLSNNRFGSTVKEVFASVAQSDAQASQFAVLCSASDQQRSHVSADLASSAFGHFLHLGMAGEADSLDTGGNGDGWVDVEELRRYVGSNVVWWSRHSRESEQTPLFLAAGEDLNFRLAKNLNESSLTQLLASQESIARPAPSVSASRLDSMWTVLGQLREERRYQLEPLSFAGIERELLWLERASRSGAGYRNAARRGADQLAADLSTIEDRIKQLPQRRDYGSVYSVLSGEPPKLPRSTRAHSLALAEFLGSQSVASTVRLRQRLDEFAERPVRAELAPTLRETEKLSRDWLADVHFLQQLDRYSYPGLLSAESVVADVLKAQSRYRDNSVPRDPSGIAGDLRFNRMQRGRLTAATLHRRTVEDQLFLQQPDKLAERLLMLQQRLDSVSQESDQVEEALRLCDKAMATLPHRARVLADPRLNDWQSDADRLLSETALPALASTWGLSSRMDRIPAGDFGVKEIEAFHQVAINELSTQLQTLEDAMTESWRRLLNASESNRPETTGEIEAALTSPLIDARMRRELRDALDRLCIRLHQNLPLYGAAHGRESETAPVENYQARLESWQRHPLDQIFGREDESRGVNRIPEFIEGIEKEIANAGEMKTLKQQLRVGVAVARKTRLAAATGFPRERRNGVDHLRNLDLQLLLLWHAEEALRDFWGPAGQSQSFFDVASSDYLKTIMEMRPEKTPVPLELAVLSGQIALGRSTAPQWLQAEAADCLQIAPTDRVPSTWTLSSNAPAAFVRPSGVGTLAVLGPAGRIPLSNAVPGEAVKVPLADTTYDVVLPADIASRGESLRATMVFRGHEYYGELNVDQLGGRRIDAQPPNYEKSEVVLNAPWDQLSVEFIIDGSASMKEVLAGPEGGPARMDVAKAALQEILFRLGMRRNVRVGVHAFGHRLGWSIDDPVRPMTRPDYSEPIDPSVTPSQDVEALLSLGPYDLKTAQWVIPKVDKIKPWGQSPLYLSVKNALEEFSEEDRSADRHVIVITDGANYQYIPPDVYDVPMTSADDVRRAWAESQVPVHILGLGMNRTNEQGAIEDFSRLCADTGGRFQSLNTSTDLSQAMAALLAPATYRLSLPATDERPEQVANLGAPIQIRPAPGRPEVFGLQYEGKPLVIEDPSEQETVAPLAYEPLVLEGGEAMRLYVDPSGANILAYPFETNVAGWSELVSPEGGSAGEVLRVHRPDHDATGKVVFPISWQRFDMSSPSDQPGQTLWRATSRPSSVWAEVIPVDAEGNAQGMTYVYQDAFFEADQPVPVMNLTAEDWPKSATTARVRLWSKPAAVASEYELLPPALEQSGGETASRINQTIAINDSLTAPFEIAPGITLRLDPLASLSSGSGTVRQRFIVDYGNSQTDVTSIKLDVSPFLRGKPLRIVRQFDSDRAIAVHTFYIDAAVDQPATQVVVTSRDLEIDGAWELADGVIEVPIPNAGGLLPVSPIRGR